MSFKLIGELKQNETPSPENPVEIENENYLIEEKGGKIINKIPLGSIDLGKIELARATEYSPIKTADEQQELWISIKQNCNYEISNLGNVRNKKTKRILKPAISNKGYYLVSLSDNCKMHTYTIHKLVKEHFDRCAFEYEVINHIDGNKLNNNINNLEYVTQKDNCIKAWNLGLCENIRKSAYQLKHSTKIKTSREVVQYDKNYNEIARYSSIREAERKTGINNSNIIKCCKNKKYKAGGYIWGYARTASNK